MTRFLGLAAVAVLAGGVWAADDKKDAPKFDASKLEGKWTITEFVRKGEKADPKDFKEPTIITKDSIKNELSFGKFEFKYTIDTKADPVGIDMEIISEMFKGGKTLGIIKLDGDKLMLAYDGNLDEKADKVRPKAFESKKDSQVMYFVLTRLKDEKKDK